MFIQILRRLFLREFTVSNVMYDFQSKVKQLKQVAELQRIKAAKEAAKIEAALKKQDKCHSEAIHADRTAEALENLTQQTNLLTLADLKKDVK